MCESAYLRTQRGGGDAPGGGGGGEPGGGGGGALAEFGAAFELAKFPETGTLWPFAYMHWI